jgi:hypothetical protein
MHCSCLVNRSVEYQMFMYVCMYVLFNTASKYVVKLKLSSVYSSILLISMSITISVRGVSREFLWCQQSSCGVTREFLWCQQELDARY